MGNELSSQSPLLVLILLGLQGLWGLVMVLLGMIMRRILKDIEKNTEATTGVAAQLNAMNVLLTGNYVLKSEHDRLEGRLRDAESRITELRTRDDYREQIRQADRR